MTRTLSLLGAALPRRLMAPVENNNEAGFWEPQSVADLNDEILQALDSEWDDVFAFRPRQYLSNFDNYYVGRAAELIEEEFNGSELIVLKDPRISVLSSFWSRVLRKAGYATHHVIMVRNPLEVAESLRARDEFPREKSLLLWSSYMVAVDRDTRGLRRTFVSYDQLMSNWRSVRKRIEEEAGFPFPRDTAAASIDIDRHLQPRLHHNKAASEDVFASDEVPEQTKALYRIFSDACEGATVDEAAVDAIQAELAKIDALMGPLIADMRARGRQLTKDLGEARAAHDAADARARSLEDERARLQQEIEERQRQIAELTEQLADERARLQRETEERQREAAELAEQVAEERARLEEEIKERQRQAVELAEQLADERVRLGREVEQTQRQAAELAEQLADERARSGQEVEETQRQAAELAGQLADERVRLEQIEESQRRAAQLAEQLSVELAAAAAEREQIAIDAQQKELHASELGSRLEALHLELGRLRDEVGRKERQLDDLARLSAAAEAKHGRAASEARAELKRERAARLEEESRRTLAESRVEEGHRKLARLVDHLESREKDLTATGAELDAALAKLSSTEDQLRQAGREVTTVKRTAREHELAATTKERQLQWLKLVNEALAASTPGWRGLMPPGWRRRRQLRVLKRRGLFDSAAYLERYPDVVEDGMDPLLHYIMYGMNESRQLD